MSLGVFMDLSLIIPCHNLESDIEWLCKSLLSQDTSKYEVEYIFVLDNCTDRTSAVINSYNLPNCSIMTCCVNRAGIARNIGLEQAKGDYIWFVDGDDWWLGNDCFNLVLDTIKSEHCNRVQFGFESNFFNKKNPVMVWQYVFSREFLWGLRFCNMLVEEDNVFYRDVLNKEMLIPGLPPVRYINKNLYYYNYKREGSLTTLTNVNRDN